MLQDASISRGRMAADMANALGEHAPTWISIVIEEMLREEDLDFKVTLAS